MRTISDTIARLAALRAQSAAGFSYPGSSNLSTLSDFEPNPGALEAWFYRPDNLPAGAPLVVVLHGCTQDAAGYDHHSGWSQLAETAGFALLYPQQQRAGNPNLCFNWFLPADTRRDSGEALSIRQMIEAMVVRHGLDRKRIFITGLSAGGAMACSMLATYPEIFAGGAIVAGLPHGSATSIPQAFDRMRGHGGPSERELQALLDGASAHTGPWPKLSIWQGEADRTVAASNAEAIAAQWRHVHKVETAPTRSMVVGRHARRIWCDGAGEPRIEINLIAGMGHGTPLGDDGLGAPGPFMLDVGVSSTREIASFWGVTKAVTRPAAGSRPAAADAVRPPSSTYLPDAGQAEAMSSRSSRAPSSPPGVKKIIEDALRAAGLMR